MSIFVPSDVQTILPSFRLAWEAVVIHRDILQLVESFTSEIIQLVLLSVLFKVWSKPPTSGLPGVLY